MRRRSLSFWFRAFLAVLAVLAVIPAVGQQPATISISTGSAEIGRLLQRGQALEGQRRWGDALTHYEDAMRMYPGESSLRRRFEFTRVHYDLQRRYADRSFLGAVVKLPPEEALDLYSQVMLKIQVYYVEAPDWRKLVEHGTDNLEIALREPAFVARNSSKRERTAVDEFFRRVRQVLSSRAIDSPGSARDAVATAARLAQGYLAISRTAVVLEYLCGATNTLDPYSAYLTPAQLDEAHGQIDGNFVGLGIELKSRDHNLLIERVIPDSPAERSGIVAGDQIVSVDGQPTLSLSTDQVANLLQGDAGDVVSLVVRTPPQPPRKLSIGRCRVDVPSIDKVQILDHQDGIAYLRLVCFQKNTCSDLEAALWKLYRQGMKKLIIDVRRNPGGLLDTAVEVSDKFIQRGIIVSTRGRNTEENSTYSAHPPGTWRVPLVVLIDRDTASAAEIFAGAVREHRRGTIVGTRSYGKDSVQRIIPLNFNGAGVRLTTAKFFSPSGRPYGLTGVQPDVRVQTSARPIDGSLWAPPAGADAMLEAALQTARGIGQAKQARNLPQR